ncbi:hypothetical protein DXG01_000895 [Tephrocybe rancida]|nr:hypothetical protein DXG01_000895 [Tephrocybe rancida]
MLGAPPMRTGPSRPQNELPDVWKLNEDFFNVLSQWTLELLEERDLEIVLKCSSIAIDKGKKLIELIPTAPFAVGSFIMSLSFLFSLELKMAIAQDGEQAFAFKILAWVNQVKESWDQAEKEHWTAMTWENLSQME